MTTTCQQFASRWSGADQPIAYGVCMAESSGNPNAHCPSCAGVAEDSRGLGQVNVLANPQYVSWDLYDVATNAEASYQIQRSQGWRAWSTYTSGAYLPFANQFPGAVPIDGTSAPGPAAPPAGLLLVAAAIAALWLLN